jgi:hypothetical protein
VKAECVFEEGRIPIEIKDIKKLTDTVIINPEHSIVKHGSTVGVKF